MPDVINTPITVEQNIISAPITIGSKGLKGDQGVPGIPVGVSFIAGEALGGHRVVIVDGSSGLLFYADSSNINHANKIVGMTDGAVIQGDPANVVIYGEVAEPTWNWTLDIPIWIGSNGLLTQSSPSVGFSRIIGFPVLPTKIFVELREPIFLT